LSSPDARDADSVRRRIGGLKYAEQAAKQETLAVMSDLVAINPQHRSGAISVRLIDSRQNSYGVVFLYLMDLERRAANHIIVYRFPFDTDGNDIVSGENDRAPTGMVLGQNYSVDVKGMVINSLTANGVSYQSTHIRNTLCYLDLNGPYRLEYSKDESQAPTLDGNRAIIW
jgi:hypothetical protein